MSITQDFEMTPHTNRGSAGQLEIDYGLDCRVDWLTYIIRYGYPVDREEHLKLLENLFGDGFDRENIHPTKSGQFWECSTSSGLGIRVAWNDPRQDSQDSEKSGKMRVEIPGSCIACITQESVCELIMHVRNRCRESKFTRIDIALDDYSKSTPISEVRRACEAGQVYGAKTWRYIVGKNVSKLTGETLYLGSKNSDKLLRYYDKSLESKGEIDSFRWEIQFRDEYANNCCASISEIVEACINSSGSGGIATLVIEYLKGLLPGHYKFAEKDASGRRDRAKELPWWVSLCERIASLTKVAVERPKPTLERCMNWFSKQVETTVSMVLRHLGEREFVHWLKDRLESGDRRINGRHEAILAAAYHYPVSYSPIDADMLVYM